MTDKKDKAESDPSDKAIEGSITCNSYLDSHGRVYIPLRVRDRAGLERGISYEIGITGRVLSDFKEHSDE